MPKRKYEIDMCTDPLLPKLFQFALPLMLSGVLQLLFNAADIIVVGRFSGKEALAAVGSTGSLINLLVNVFMGLSIGTNVLAARYVGAKDGENVRETLHTSIAVSIICGTLLIFAGAFLAEPLLVMMGTPDDVLPKAALYVRIYFLSMPAVMLYNFGSAVLRAVGDTKRPLFYLTVSGIINVICNLFFVIVLKWDVAGVAVATSISQIISALLVLHCLMHANEMYRADLKKVKIHKDKLLAMVKIGIPAGLQGCIFSLSNVLIQSSINSFGSVAMAGNAAAVNIEGFVWISMSAFYQANLSFTSQNLGGQKYSRINKIAFSNIAIAMILGLILGNIVYFFGGSLISIYNGDPGVISFGMRRSYFVVRYAFLGGFMDVASGALRGLGYSMIPTLVSLTGACGLRVLWIFTIFKANPTPEVLFLSYPVSWAITALCHTACFLWVRRKLPDVDIEPM